MLYSNIQKFIGHFCCNFRKESTFAKATVDNRGAAKKGRVPPSLKLRWAKASPFFDCTIEEIARYSILRRRSGQVIRSWPKSFNLIRRAIVAIAQFFRPFCQFILRREPQASDEGPPSVKLQSIKIQIPIKLKTLANIVTPCSVKA